MRDLGIERFDVGVVPDNRDLSPHARGQPIGTSLAEAAREALLR